MQNGGEDLQIIIFVSQGLLVKMLITLELMVYKNQILHTHNICSVRKRVQIRIDIIETQVCKTVIRLCQDIFYSKA